MAALPGAVGNEWAMELLRYTATLTPGQWAVEILQYIATVPLGNGQWNSCGTLPHCQGQWVVELLRRTAAPFGGHGQWKACGTLPRCLGAVGNGTPAAHCRLPGAMGS